LILENLALRRNKRSNIRNSRARTESSGYDPGLLDLDKAYPARARCQWAPPGCPQRSSASQSDSDRRLL
jgi:hypothetical protein